MKRRARMPAWVGGAGLSLLLLLSVSQLAPAKHPAPPTATPRPPGCARFLPLSPSGPLPPARHDPATADLPPAPPRRAPDFRYAVHTLFLNELTARLAQEAGFDTVVQVFAWRDFSPERGVYHWAAGDAMVRAARAHNLELVVRLDMPPEWARGPDEFGLPFDLAAYADFVTAVAQRYRGHVLGYIVWNEPNLAAEWSRSGETADDHWDSFAGAVADPADYVGVVGAAYDRLRAADPAALVVAGGLAPTNEFSERAIDDREFLRGLYSAGLAQCSDVLAVHTYSQGLPPDADRAANDGLNLARLLDGRDIMTAYGDARPVWITELGYTLHSGSQPAVSEAEQAAYLVGAYQRARREWPWVKMLTVWNLSYGRDPADEMGGYSLLNYDTSPRPAYESLRAMPK